MNLVRCSNGHFFDQENYESCPHCAAGGAPNPQMTRPAAGGVANDAKTAPLTIPKEISGQETASMADGGSLKQVVQSFGASAVEEDEKTVSFYKKSLGSEPVVGWLVCIQGEHFGEDFRLKSGRNFIGRASSMDVSLSKDSSVSREKHAVIVYEPRSHIFLVQPGESKELCYINDEVILKTEEIKHMDKLNLGESTLMFFPCCSKEFNWEMVMPEDDKEK